MIITLRQQCRKHCCRYAKRILTPDITYTVCIFSTCRREIKGNAGDFYEKKRTRHRPACAVSLIIRVSGKEQKLKRAFAGSTAGTSIIAATSIFSVAGAAIKKKFVKTIWKNGFLTTLQKNWNATNWTVKWKRQRKSVHCAARIKLQSNINCKNEKNYM